MKNKTYAVVSDIHFPNHDEKAVKVFLDTLDQIKVDEVVLNGDILDFGGLSSHADASAAERVKADAAVVGEFLDAIQRRRIRVSWNDGNHDDRLYSFVERVTPQLTGLVSIPDLLSFKKRRIDYMRYSGDSVRFLSPKLGVTHGALFGAHYTKDTLSKYGVSMIVGHAHRPQYSEMPTVGPDGCQARGCWGLGCMVPVQHVRYLRKPSGWTQGFGLVSVHQSSGDFAVQQVNLIRGRPLVLNIERRS